MDIFKKTETIAFLLIALILIALVGFWGGEKSLYSSDGKEVYKIKKSGAALADNKFVPATK
jgi:hypothetical protein